MKIDEVKAMVPEADVYGLSPMGRYMIVVDRKMVSEKTAHSLVFQLCGLGIPAFVVLVNGSPSEAMKIYEEKVEEEDASHKN